MTIPFLNTIPDSILNFSNTLIDDTSYYSLAIENWGYGDLIISNISTGNTNSGFTVSGNSLIIPPQEDDSLVIYFFPDTAGLYTAQLEFETNDTNNANFSLNIQG